MDEILQYLGTHLNQECSVITQAPIIFTTIAGVLAVGFWFALRAYFHHEIATGAATINFLHERLADGPTTTIGGQPKSFAPRYQVVRKCTELADKCHKAASDTHIWITMHNRIMERELGEPRKEGEYEVGWQKDLAQLECSRLEALATEFKQLAEELIDEEPL